eukprot:565293-Prorocentrum_minimum.AAC.1
MAADRNTSRRHSAHSQSSVVTCSPLLFSTRARSSSWFERFFLPPEVYRPEFPPSLAFAPSAACAAAAAGGSNGRMRCHSTMYGWDVVAPDVPAPAPPSRLPSAPRSVPPFTTTNTPNKRVNTSCQNSNIGRDQKLGSTLHAHYTHPTG